MRARYGQVLAQPDVARTLLPYLVGRLPTGMVMLALLLLVQRETGTFAAAGTVSGCFAAGVACTSPLLGRLVDARGQSRVLLVTGLVHPATLVGIVLLSQAGVGALALSGAALVAGACMPPLSGCMRALWPQLLRTEQLRTTGYAVEVVVVEACELGGPLVVGSLVALASPVAAVLASAVLSLAGALGFALSPASRSWRGGRRRGSWTGPLALLGVRRLLLVVLTSTGGLAVLEVAVASFATERGQSGSLGPLLAAWFAGSLVGGWLYGARVWRAPLQNQLVGLLLLVVAGTGLTVLADGLVSLGALLLVAGLAVGPATAVQFAVMAHVSPAESRTEAFTWASTANFLGVGAGNALAGALLHVYGTRAALLLACAPAMLAVVAALTGRRALGMPVVRRPLVVPWEEHAEALVEVDRAQEEVRAATARNVELALEVARLRQALAEAVPVPQRRATDPPQLAARVLEGLGRAEEELAALEVRRQQVADDVASLRRTLTGTVTPGDGDGAGGTVTPLRPEAAPVERPAHAGTSA